jgi:hypothetical protein
LANAQNSAFWTGACIAGLDLTADHIGGSARGYPAGFGSLAARLQPIAIGPNLYFYAAPRSE